MNRENHPSITFSSLLESLDVVVKNVLVSGTLDLDKCNLTSSRILDLNIDSFSDTTEYRDSFPTSPCEEKVN